MGRLAATATAAVLCAAHIELSATPAAAADLGGTRGDVELTVEERWLSADERHPGTDNPGRTVFARYRGEIPPRGSQCFVFHPSPPLPARSDGRFQIAAQVTQYMQIYAATEAAPAATHARIVTHPGATR